MAVRRLPDPDPPPEEEATAREARQRAEEIHRLMAKGSDVTLANGDVVAVVFSPRMLASIELEYGSIADYSLALGANLQGRLFHHVAFALGLVLGVKGDGALDQMDPRRIGDYLDAVNAALFEALPEQVRGGNPGGPTTGQPSSPGAASSTSPSPSSA